MGGGPRRRGAARGRPPPATAGRLATQHRGRGRDPHGMGSQGSTTKQALGRRYGVSNVWIARILAGQEATEPFPLAILAYPLLATYLLTGGRESEVTGLELDDVSLDRKTITFRPNSWRRLKTPGSHRVVRLWPQLEEILRPLPPLAASWSAGVVSPVPSPWSNRRANPDPRHPPAASTALPRGPGWRPARLAVSKMFRHTYCAARLQTLDRGAPVSSLHRGPRAWPRVRGHGAARLRTPWHDTAPIRGRGISGGAASRAGGERLKKLGIVTGNVTGASTAAETKSPATAQLPAGRTSSDEWAWVELNYRPHAYQACALTT